MEYVGRYFINDDSKIWYVEKYDSHFNEFVISNDEVKIYMSQDKLKNADWLMYKKQTSIDAGNSVIWTINLVLWIGLIYLYTTVG